jgi:transketolase
MFSAWQQANPELAQQLTDAIEKKVPADLFTQVPTFPTDAKIATRKAGSEVLQPLAKAMPFFISGSADLHGSTLNYIEGGEDFSRDNHKGRNIRFGIREHGMCAIMNGIGYHGVFRASGATFLVFADYCRASIRLAALSKLPNIYIFTHDSIGVGEDGPTHEPVETVTGGPTLLALTRQAVPMLNEIDVNTRREGVARGGYIAKRETGELNCILLSCGSELQHAMAAAKELGEGTRVVSMPCFERFERQSEEYREEVLPSACRRRVAIEAGVPDVWYRYVGLDGKVIGLHRFGLSAPGDQVMKEFGIDAQHVIAAARSV